MVEVKTFVLSLGGSIIAPVGVDMEFLAGFRKLIRGLLPQNRFIIICGGGRVCREYQEVARRITEVSGEDLDWIGISATRLNAELVRSIFGRDAYYKVIHDPFEKIDGSWKIIVGAGFEPGSSTDLRAVQIAQRFNAGDVINISNIDYVYMADPNKDPEAKRLIDTDWSEFRRLIGDEWDPGLNAPFDPVASKEAQGLGLTVRIVGSDLENLERLLKGRRFKGTTIS